MSGPKVIRVVTREERIAHSKGLLLRHRKALLRWQNKCLGLELVTTEEITAFVMRYEAFEKLLDKDQFDDLEEHIPKEIAFLKKDFVTRRAEKAKFLSLQKKSAKDQKQVALDFLQRLEKSGISIEDSLRHDLKAISQYSNKEALSSEQASSQVFHKAMEALAEQKAKTSLSEKQAKLAKKLAQDNDTDTAQNTIEQWLQAHHKGMPSIEGRFARLEQQISLLSLMGLEEAEEAARVTQRLEAIMQETNKAQQDMLADSLSVALGAYQRERQQAEMVLETLSEVLAEARSVSSVDAKVIEMAQIILDQEQAEKAQSVIERLEQDLAESREQEAQAFRKQALMEALSSLGYELQEGMATALVQDGSLVLRSAGRPDYGLKLSGGQNGPLQLRAVGDQSRNQTHDIDAEKIWCSELAKIRNNFSDNAGGLTIEYGVKPGAVAVETVTFSGTAGHQTYITKSTPKTLKRE